VACVKYRLLIPSKTRGCCVTYAYKCVRLRVQLTDVLVQLDAQTVVIKHHVSSTTVKFTFHETALLIDTKLTHVGVYVTNRHIGNWTDIT
jgi:hypothetical protein